MSQHLLAYTTLVVNVALGLSYLRTGVRTSDFGRVPVELHAYLLVMAALAFACILVYVVLLVRRVDVVRPTDYLVATACVALYYVLQMAFLPLVRASTVAAAPASPLPPSSSSTAVTLSRVWVRALLGLCVPPMVVLAWLGVRYGHDEPALPVLGLFVTGHVFINDFAIYGFLF